MIHAQPNVASSRPAEIGSKPKSRILVVEDHPLVRDGLVRLLDRQTDMMCCGQTEGVVATPAAVRALQPDLVLLDLTLKDGDGLELLSHLVQQFPVLRVLVLSQHDEETHAELAIRHGASGYVMKQEATDIVISAIRTVLAGEIHLSHRMAARMLHKLTSGEAGLPVARTEKLSDREMQVLQLLGGGLSTREIAGELSLSIKTVETYREHLKAKLGLVTAVELTQYAQRHVLRQPTPPPA